MSLQGALDKGGRRLIFLATLLAGTIIGMLIVFGAQVTRSFGQTEALRAEVIRSYEARSELQRILSLHQDVETGQRGYVLTANTSFLEPYEQANREIDTAFALLENRLLTEPSLTPRLRELQALSAAKRRFTAETIGLVRQGQLAAARDQVALGRGKAVMDAIRRAIANLTEYENSALAQRTAQAEAARAQLQNRATLLPAVLLVLLLAALVYLGRTYLSWQRTLSRERDLAARQEAIFDAARDGMIMVNESGGIESLNPAAARMFGYQADELLRRDVGLLFEIAPDRGQVETFLKRLAARRAETAGRQEFAGRCKDGTLFPAEVSLSPVRLASDTRFLAVLRDVTERKQVERMKTEFVSTVSHELRTPLTSIAGSLGLITGGAAGELPPRALRLVDIAKSNCARLIRLINDILDIEKIESGSTSFDIQPLPLNRLLEQAAEANRAFAGDLGVTVHVEPVPAGASIFADEDRVMQVLTNLLSNAAKFSPRGGVVDVSVRPLDRQYRISITDQGPGIPPEFHDRIFTKFAQADSSDTRQKGGTGLGLSIVREIVTRLGGSVSFDSNPGQGATFHVALPAADRCVVEHEPSKPLGRLGDAGLPNILHVDDDPDMLRIVSSALEGMAEVQSTPSLLEARASLLRFAFDAVILDIGMADGDGRDLIPLIRKKSHTPVVLFTAQDADPAGLAGADEVLTKSRDSLDRLVEVVRDLVSRPARGQAA